MKDLKRPNEYLDGLDMKHESKKTMIMFSKGGGPFYGLGIRRGAISPERLYKTDRLLQVLSDWRQSLLIAKLLHR